MRKPASLVLLLAVVLVVGCATSKPVASGHANLSGTWQLTLPSGFQHKVAITSEGAQRYRLSGPGLVFNGIYEVRGDSLVITVPYDQRLTGFLWQIDDANHLTLIEEPPAGKTGVRYRTATLKRVD